jgi:ABC-2 type transport system ATP-binding protein
MRDIQRMMNNAAVDVRGLRVVRGGRVVLPGLDASITSGSITALLGPSGCGKSTLLRSIVGVQQVTAGTVEVLGRPAGDPSLRRRVGYVTQAPSVYADLSVRENLRYVSALLRAARGDVDRVIGEVGLDDHADALVGRLSGGQRTRVTLAAALLGTPELLVLDEPTVGLDPLVREELWRIFSELAARGATLLVSSHVMDEAARCHRLLLMREGRIIADAPPNDLLEETGTPDVEAAFLQLVRAEAAGVAA